MKQQFVERTELREKTRQQIDIANAIIEEYVMQGYRLTLRQLYYQHGGGTHGLDDVLDEMLVAVEDEVIDCFCQAYTALNGVVAPSVLMPVEED